MTALAHKIGTTSYVDELMDLADPSGAIARQYIPSAEELVPFLLDQTDPIGDHKHAAGPALIHRYPDRALFLATDHCAVYCRFCFRKDRVGKGPAVRLQNEIEQAFDYIKANKNLWEIIFSGGDPLILSPRRMKDLISRLDEIEHVKVIRFHTRVPVADPARVTDELAAAMTSGKATYLVVHANHPDEFTVEAKAAFKKLRAAGITLLSQSVLLRGVNDNAETLEKLFRGFVEAGVKPYYLHHPDLVEGTAHFQVTIAEGQKLMRGLRGRVSGLCWPTYVLDIPGGHGKMPINDTYLEQQDNGQWRIEDYQGQKHLYPPLQKLAVK